MRELKYYALIPYNHTFFGNLHFQKDLWAKFRAILHAFLIMSQNTAQ